jgi:hypothetical protein
VQQHRRRGQRCLRERVRRLFVACQTCAERRGKVVNYSTSSQPLRSLIVLATLAGIIFINRLCPYYFSCLSRYFSSVYCTYRALAVYCCYIVFKCYLIFVLCYCLRSIILMRLILYILGWCCGWLCGAEQSLASRRLINQLN